jgi:tRNA uridine 5-carboxymethylaminomethyl modification enzyme
MFTSRAGTERWRQDNADFRLTPKGHEIGLASELRLRRMEHKLKESNNMVSFLETSVSVAEANPILESKYCVDHSRR